LQVFRNEPPPSPGGGLLWHEGIHAEAAPASLRARKRNAAMEKNAAKNRKPKRIRIQFRTGIRSRERSKKWTGIFPMRRIGGMEPFQRADQKDD
jgi:hypothetical protein